MDTFPLLKIHLCRLGILRWDKSPRAKTIAIMTNCIVLGSCTTHFIITACYLAFTVQTNSEFSAGFAHTLISLIIIWWYLLLVWNKEKIGTLLEDIDVVIEKRSEDDAIIKTIYRHSNNKITRYTKFYYVLYNQIICPIFITTPIMISFIKYVSSDYSNESFLQIFPATFPFDWKTPTGYLGCTFIQILITTMGAEISCTVNVLVFGLCYFATSLGSDLEEKLRQFDYVMSASKNGSYSPRQQDKLRKMLGDFINFHGEARELTVQISDIVAEFIFAEFTFVVVTFGSLCLIINASIGSGDISGILQSSMLIALNLLNLFLFCHFGDNATSRFESLGDKVYQLNWYMLPLDMQKDLITVIAMSQKRVFVRGYADIRSTRQVFKKILKNKFFCIVMIRKL